LAGGGNRRIRAARGARRAGERHQPPALRAARHRQDLVCGDLRRAGRRTAASGRRGGRGWRRSPVVTSGLAGLRLAQRLVTPGDTLLLFDEAEDLFVSRNTSDDEPSTNSRVFMHRLLERMAVPVIWTANDISVLGPAVLGA
jgi:hypothetical protein